MNTNRNTALAMYLFVIVTLGASLSLAAAILETPVTATAAVAETPQVLRQLATIDPQAPRHIEGFDFQGYAYQEKTWNIGDGTCWLHVRLDAIDGWLPCDQPLRNWVLPDRK